jgi:small subunit ribosomal protein S8e
MARAQSRSKRKLSGGRYHSSRSKRKFELARYAAQTKLAAGRKIRSLRILGGNKSYALLATNHMNVADKKGKVQKTEIVTVLENPANPHLVRRNILTKGAIVETKLGKAIITSRPGQEGTVNGVLV